MIAVIFGSAPARAGLGLEVVLRPGYGSAGDTSPTRYEANPNNPMQASTIWDGTAKPYGGGFVLDGAVGYRPLSFVSVGLTGGWRTSAVSSSANEPTGVSRSAWQVGFYGRGYLPVTGALNAFDPWASVGVNYVYDKQTYDQSLTVPTGTVSLRTTGSGSLGRRNRLPHLALFCRGPSFQYEIVTGMGGCMIPPGGESHQCSDADSSIRVTAAKNYGVWSIGLGLRLLCSTLLANDQHNARGLSLIDTTGLAILATTVTMLVLVSSPTSGCALATPPWRRTFATLAMRRQPFRMRY